MQTHQDDEFDTHRHVKKTCRLTHLFEQPTQQLSNKDTKILSLFRHKVHTMFDFISNSLNCISNIFKKFLCCISQMIKCFYTSLKKTNQKNFVFQTDLSANRHTSVAILHVLPTFLNSSLHFLDEQSL